MSDEPAQAAPKLTTPIAANNGTEVVVSGALLIIRNPNFQQDTMVAVLTHAQAAEVIKSLVAAHDLSEFASLPSERDVVCSGCHHDKALCIAGICRYIWFDEYNHRNICGHKCSEAGSERDAGPTHLVVTDDAPNGWRVEAWYATEDEADTAANRLKPDGRGEVNDKL